MALTPLPSPNFDGAALADRVNSATGVLLPVTDNTQALGSATRRIADEYVTRLHPGAGTVTWTSGVGTPEGAVAAPVGSLFTRTDGGANTTLYVKETGTTTNLGWVAK